MLLFIRVGYNAIGITGGCLLTRPGFKKKLSHPVAPFFRGDFGKGFLFKKYDPT